MDRPLTMNKHDLQIGLICYWQDCGFHGCHQIVKFNCRFVHYIDPEEKGINKQIFKKGIRIFLNSHIIYTNCCDYGSYHKNIGKVLTIV